MQILNSEGLDPEENSDNKKGKKKNKKDKKKDKDG